MAVSSLLKVHTSLQENRYFIAMVFLKQILWTFRVLWSTLYVKDDMYIV
jgi:hypothetical protein